MARRGGGAPGERLSLGGDAMKHVDAYWEYTRIVGNDDGGVPFTPEQYEKYKKEVIPMRLKNRVYVSWVNQTGMDCILIGPETPCFCGHRYKQHQTDFKELPKNRPILLPCNEPGCPCSTYEYVPKNGSQAVRCGCKHTSEEHRPAKPFNCLKSGCKCSSFKSSFTCNCGEPTYAHYTLAESKEMRQARGHPVGQDVPYAAMGGLTGFSSNAGGYIRLDPSGIGKPSDEFLNQPITDDDLPILRQYGNLGTRNSRGQIEPNPQALSAMRQPGEDELDYYERRYQERKKAERTSVPKPIQSNPYGSNSRLETGSRNPPKKY